MPISDIASITITLESAAATRPGFGVAAIFPTLTAAQTTALFGATARGVEVNQSTYATTLDNAGIATSDDAYRCLDKHYGQNRATTKAIIGRRDTKVAEVWTVTVGPGTTDGLYRIVVNGVNHDYTASGDTATAIRDALVTAVGTPADVTVAAVSTDQISLTSDNAGQPINVSVVAPGAPDMVAAVTTPGTGLREDIAALEAERTDWYMVLEPSHVDVDTFSGALAANTSARDILFMTQTTDALAQNGGSSADIGSRLQAMNYQRTFLGWHDDVDEMVPGALSGKMLPADPGAEVSREVLRSFQLQVARQANKKVYVIMALLAGAKTRGLWSRLPEFLD